MENPYAQAAAPGPATPEQQKLADYELAIGQNSSYYMARFARFDEGESTASWNWPAFFVTSGWYLYRKMWLWGVLNLFFPLIASFVLGIVAAALKPPPAVTGFAFFGVWLAEQILLTVFANALYWRRINAVIQNVPRSLADKPDKRMHRLEREGGTSIGAAIGILFGVGFVGIGMIGMMAAIAIPAYQDYTIRAQVSEGLVLAAAPKAAIAEYYAQKSEWPQDAETAGVRPGTGNYVESITVERGSIVIAYGGKANTNLAGKRLVLWPGVTRDGQLVWACGARDLPPEVTIRGPGPHGSEVLTKYLPSQCRPAAGT
jgi:type IV pilus assembly protein PilA